MRGAGPCPANSRTTAWSACLQNRDNVTPALVPASRLFWPVSTLSPPHCYSGYDVGFAHYSRRARRSTLRQ